MTYNMGFISKNKFKVSVSRGIFVNIILTELSYSGTQVCSINQDSRSAECLPYT